MIPSKFETEKFSGKNDFGLWRIKMKALLIQQGLAEALKGEKGLSDKLSESQRDELMEKAHSAIILCLFDKVLRDVSRETTTAGVWAKLEQLYMTKSLANRLYMKQHLYSYKFTDDRGIGEQLDEFNKSINDLENIDVQLEDEDKAIILLNALPKCFEHLKDAMLFGRENTITIEEVQTALRAKELQKKKNDEKQTPTTEVLNIKKFKSNFKGKKAGSTYQKIQQAKPKENEEKEMRKCNYCKKTGHLKKDCYFLKRRLAKSEQKGGIAV